MSSGPVVPACWCAKTTEKRLTWPQQITLFPATETEMTTDVAHRFSGDQVSAHGRYKADPMANHGLEKGYLQWGIQRWSRLQGNRYHPQYWLTLGLWSFQSQAILLPSWIRHTKTHIFHFTFSAIVEEMVMFADLKIIIVIKSSCLAQSIFYCSNYRGLMGARWGKQVAGSEAEKPVSLSGGLAMLHLAPRAVKKGLS